MTRIEDLLEDRDMEGQDEAEEIDFILVEEETGALIGISEGMTRNFHLSQTCLMKQRGEQRVSL